MKKIIPYILILIILTGLFSPLVKARAQDVPDDGPLGDCVADVPGAGIVKGPTTYTKCNSIGKLISWKENKSATKDELAPTADFKPSSNTTPKLKLGCAFGIFGKMNLKGCVAEFFYLFFSVASIIARLAGQFLDFFVYYSTNSSSYTNEFVEKGWGVVRDVANIFFIIALLYIAIKTVLSLEGSHNKKLIANIIIIALVINFSLFTTKVVIDASNVLAKVFYNSIVSVDANGNSLQANDNGQKSVSVGLVDKFNPQELVSQNVYDQNEGTFIFLTILLTAMILYMAYVFFAVSALFVSRVISLWLAMIFAPLAFISYTVPFEIPGFGHKGWWSELLKNAFLAPVFIFFLYILVLFTGFLGNIINYTDSSSLTGTANFMQRVMSVLIPFVILMGLLMKAKKLTTEYSGEMGKAVISGAKVVGGLALGAATGGAALVGRAGIGRAGAAIANSEWTKTHGALGRGVGNIGSWVGSKSFDVRGAKIAGQTLGGITGMNLGEAQKGGFIQAQKDKVGKRRKRALELEVGENEELTQTLHALENNLQELRAEGSHEIAEIDKRIEGAIKASKAAQAAVNADPTNQLVRNKAITASNRVNDLRQQRGSIKNASGTAQNMANLNADLTNRQAHLQLAQQTGIPADVAEAEADLHATQIALQVAQRAAGLGNRSMNNFEDTLIPDAHHEIERESRRRKRAYADQITRFGRIWGPLGSKANREAAHKVRMEAKIEEKGGEH